MNRCCCLDVGKGSLVGGIQADKRNKTMEESSTASECRVIHLSLDRSGTQCARQKWSLLCELPD